MTLAQVAAFFNAHQAREAERRLWEFDCARGVMATDKSARRVRRELMHAIDATREG